MAKRFEAFGRVALRKLLALDAAEHLKDLRTIGNNLEPLRGRRQGQHSIRVNDAYRVCFEWDGHDAYGVEITNHYD